MNAKEAKEIVLKTDDNEERLSRLMDYAGARKYLEAIEKASGLAKALKESTLNCDCCEFKENPCANCLRQEEALAQWEKEA